MTEVKCHSIHQGGGVEIKIHFRKKVKIFQNVISLWNKCKIIYSPISSGPKTPTWSINKTLNNKLYASMKENIYLELHLRYTFVDTFVDTRASAGRVVWFQGWDDQWTAASSWMELSCGLFLSTKMVRWNKGWCEIFELIANWLQNWLQNFLAPQRETALNITIHHFGDQVIAMQEKSRDLDII